MTTSRIAFDRTSVMSACQQGSSFLRGSAPGHLLSRDTRKAPACNYSQSISGNQLSFVDFLCVFSRLVRCGSNLLAASGLLFHTATVTAARGLCSTWDTSSGFASVLHDPFDNIHSGGGLEGVLCSWLRSGGLCCCQHLLGCQPALEQC